MQDKLTVTNGYWFMNEEETMFLDGMSKKEVKPESGISLMIQFFDGKGNNLTRAKSNEHFVHDNATSNNIALQSQAFCKGKDLSNTKRTLWLENGFGQVLCFRNSKSCRWDEINHHKSQISMHVASVYVLRCQYGNKYPLLHSQYGHLVRTHSTFHLSEKKSYDHFSMLQSMHIVSVRVTVADL